MISTGKLFNDKTLMSRILFTVTEWLTAVGVDKLRVHESDAQVVQHGRFVQVAQSCEVILAHQNVRVTERRQSSAFRV